MEVENKEDQGNGEGAGEGVASTNASTASAKKAAPAKASRKKSAAKADVNAKIIASSKKLTTGVREKKAPNRDLPKNPLSKKAAALEALPAVQRKRIADLEKKEKAAKAAMDKWDVQLKQVQKKVVNIKWPVKDEQVLDYARLAQDQTERKRGARKR